MPLLLLEPSQYPVRTMEPQKNESYTYQVTANTPPPQLLGGAAELDVFVSWKQPMGGLGGIGPLDEMEASTWVTKP